MPCMNFSSLVFPVKLFHTLLIEGRKYAPFIEQYKEDELKSRFYNLRSLFDHGDARSKIYYFWPDRCEDNLTLQDSDIHNGLSSE